MKLWGNVAAVIAVVIGAIWTLQGANILGGSFMSVQSQWLYIGIAVVYAGSSGFVQAGSKTRWVGWCPVNKMIFLWSVRDLCQS